MVWIRRKNLHFLTNFKETKEKERCKGSTGDSQPFEVRVDLELGETIRMIPISREKGAYRKEKKIEPERHHIKHFTHLTRVHNVPEGHPQVGLIGKRQRSVTDTLQVGQSVLENRQVVCDSGGNSRLEEAVLHEIYTFNVITWQGAG